MGDLSPTASSLLERLKVLYEGVVKLPLRIDPIVCRICQCSGLAIDGVETTSDAEQRARAASIITREKGAGSTGTENRGHRHEYPASTQQEAYLGEEEPCTKEDASLLPCGHIPGSTCLEKWKEACQKFTCPLCRLELEPPRCTRHHLDAVVSLATENPTSGLACHDLAPAGYINRRRSISLRRENLSGLLQSRICTIGDLQGDSSVEG